MTAKVISQALPVPTTNPGVADIVGFGTKGVVVLRNAINVKAELVIKNFGYEAGWRNDKHVRLVAVTTGKKTSDIVGFGENGVYISFNNGDNSFTEPKMILSNFSLAQGWRVDQHIRFMADIRNTGRCDIVGFGTNGVYVSQNDGNGNFGPAQLAYGDFGYDQTWRLEKHLRFLADVTGTGRLDIIAFGENNVYLAHNNGNGTFATAVPVLNTFCYGDTWRVDKHVRLVADLTGDGKGDIIGFGDPGVYVSLNTGSGGFATPKQVLKDFSTAQGWQVDKHPRFIADVDGDKRGDIVGFGNEGVHIAIGNGDGTFQTPQLVLKDFGVNQGWQVDKHPRFVVDLTGDGRADIIGFGDDAVYVAFNDGAGNFPSVSKLTDKFAFNGGEWTVDKTVRYVANVF